MESTEGCRSDCWAQFAKHFHKHLHLILPSLLWCEAEERMGLGEERHPAGAQQAQAKGNSYREAHICSHRNNPWFPQFSSVQLSSVAQSCPTLCDPMDCSTPGFPVHHQLSELAQTYVHRISDAIQPSHPLSSPTPPALNLSQYQSLSNELAHHIGWPKY